MSLAQADAIHARYRKSFVGRSRATRDLGLLDQIIRDTEALAAGPLAADVRGTVDERLGLYRNERAEIASIQAGGPAAIAAWRQAEWSEVTFARYLRLFGGQNRTTRDLGLLEEMAAEEARRVGSMPKGDTRLDARRQQMEANHRLYAAEVVAIGEARNLLAPTEQARLYANLANQQFETWRRHFEGKTRVTRRPALLDRVIRTLDAIRGRMVAVREMGVNTEAHLGNITKVTERIAHHRGELDKIKAARAQTGTTPLAQALGDDANKLFAAYRSEFSGQERRTRDLARLGELCDALHEVARTMQALEDERPSAGNEKNIGVVLDQLKMAEREYVAVADAKKK